MFSILGSFFRVYFLKGDYWVKGYEYYKDSLYELSNGFIKWL